MTCDHSRLSIAFVTSTFHGSTTRCMKIEVTCPCGAPVRFLGMECDEIDDLGPAATPDARTVRLPFVVGAMQ